MRPSVNCVALFELQWVQAEREIRVTESDGISSKATCIILGVGGALTSNPCKHSDYTLRVRTLNHSLQANELAVHEILPWPLIFMPFSNLHSLPANHLAVQSMPLVHILGGGSQWCLYFVRWVLSMVYITC